jgi:uncharacterized protein (TIGR00297 family)
MAIAFFYTRNELFYLMFLGSLAAATADTWGTEIGIFSRRKPRHIITFLTVPPGTSGGITAIGTSGTFAGAGIITLSGIFMIHPPLLSIFVLIVFSGILGAFVDSIIGGTIQAQYQCPHCEKITEKRLHCERYPTFLISGIRWINNDVVNLICTVSGALFVLIFIQIF